MVKRPDCLVRRVVAQSGYFEYNLRSTRWRGRACISESKCRQGCPPSSSSSSSGPAADSEPVTRPCRNLPRFELRPQGANLSGGLVHESHQQRRAVPSKKSSLLRPRLLSPQALQRPLLQHPKWCVTASVGGNYAKMLNFTLIDRPRTSRRRRLSPSTSSTRPRPLRPAATSSSVWCSRQTRTSWTSSAQVRTAVVGVRSLAHDMYPCRLLRHHHRLLARADRRPLRRMHERPVPAHRW